MPELQKAKTLLVFHLKNTIWGSVSMTSSNWLFLLALTSHHQLVMIGDVNTKHVSNMR